MILNIIWPLFSRPPALCAVFLALAQLRALLPNAVVAVLPRRSAMDAFKDF